MPNYADSSFPGLIYQSWARDNTAATRGHGFLCYKVVVFALLLNLLLLLHYDTETLRFFEFVLVPQALLHCVLSRCRMSLSRGKKMLPAQL